MYKARSFRYAGKAAHRKYSQEERNDVVEGEIVDIIHSAGHYAPLAKTVYEDKTKALEIAQLGVRVGDKISAGKKAEVEIGNTVPLSEVPEGGLVCNIEAIPGDGGQVRKIFGRRCESCWQAG